MEELDRINIQTTSSEGQSIQTVVNNGLINLTTQVSDVPQIQTVMQENVSPISSIINNPFVEVTSVNGQTGDVITEPVMEDFRTNHYYLKNTIINYNENIYWSKATFTSGNSFNINDWNKIDITCNANWDDITNKPSFSNVATSGNYDDLNNLPIIGNATLTIQRNGVNVDTFTANATNNKTINISVPVSTSQLTNDSGFINTVDSTLNTTSSNPIQNKVVTQTINDINARIDDKINYGNVQSTDIVANAIITTKIANNAITTAKIADSAVTTIKIANGAVTTGKISDGAVTAAKVVGGETASTLAGGALVEVIGTTSGSSANYAWKFADGRLICFQRYSWSGVNINGTWGGCYSAQVMTPVNYVVPFIASPIVAATPAHSASGANFWLCSNVERGVAALTHPPAYQIIRPTSSNGSAASIDIVAYGFWK